jgi:acylphosphatase
MKKRVRLVVHGLVQGVCFRMAIRDMAEKEGISGWVRNLPGGCVEAVFEGESAPMDRLVDFCHRGPRSARVDRVDLCNEQWIGEFDTFSIRY